MKISVRLEQRTEELGRFYMSGSTVLFSWPLLHFFRITCTENLVSRKNMLGRKLFSSLSDSSFNSVQLWQEQKHTPRTWKIGCLQSGTLDNNQPREWQMRGAVAEMPCISGAFLLDSLSFAIGKTSEFSSYGRWGWGSDERARDVMYAENNWPQTTFSQGFFGLG